MTDRPRNVVLLTVDALRADHCSCHGYEWETTPTIDALARAHLHRPSAFSASSHTREAVPAILTGRYPDEAVDGAYHLAADTVATPLSAAGFATGGFHSNPFVSRAYGFDRGFDAFDDDLHLGSHKVVALAQRAFDKLRNRHYARGETINRRSLAWIDSLEGRPFFCWNHYMDPHGPYEPPDAYRRRFHESPVGDRAAGRLYRRAIRAPESISDDERRTLLDLYDAEIRYLDDQVGAFLDALEARDRLSETLVVLTADHGDAFGEHGYYEHPRYLVDELVRVPLVALGPGVPETSSDRPASTLDVVPTILEAVGAPADGLPGEPLQRAAEADRLADDGDGRHADGADHGVEDDGEDRVVFAQARSSDDPAVRRYGAWGLTGHATIELDTSDWEAALQALDPPDSPFEAALRAHCTERLEVAADGSSTLAEGGDADGPEAGDDAEDAEILARLEALGYKE